MSYIINATSPIRNGKELDEVRILIAEDDEGIREFIGAFLVDEGYHVFMANNGQEALTLAETQKPDLIFMDVFMPIMDGRAFMSAYRDSGQRVPVIGMSANANDTSLVSLFDGFISKPFDLDELIECIEAFTKS
jgi:two-component system, OmpR family, response regulator